MANRWNIPEWLEQEVTARDRHCVYCGIPFQITNTTRKNKPSWEHIVNDAKIITRDNIALCCIGCNASKGAKSLAMWLESSYCKTHNINKNTVSEVVRRAIEK